MYETEYQTNYLSIYDLRTSSMTTHSNDIYLPLPTEYGACITMSDQYIFIIGGLNPFTSEYRRDLQIYSRIDADWIPDPPLMCNTRYTSACIATEHTGFLYVKYEYVMVIINCFIGSSLTGYWRRYFSLNH